MNDINTVENKLFIWKLLVDNGSFNKLSKEQMYEIYENYDSIVTTVNNDSKGDNLIEKNKKLIYILNENINTLYNSQSTSRQPITAEEIILKRQEQFNENLNSKRQEFDNLITVNKPDEIDFMDKKEPPIKDMDSMLSSVISSRENDLKIDYTKLDNQKTNTFITIGENIDISNDNVKTITNADIQVIINKLNDFEIKQELILKQINKIYDSIKNEQNDEQNEASS